MKDIKRYFANGAGLDVLSGAAESSRLERGPAAVAARGGGRKRGRVKIRITRTSSRERVCDIVESKNDLIDKTPSPFTRPSDDERVARDGTPKCSRGGAERDLEKVIEGSAVGLRKVTLDLRRKSPESLLLRSV